MQKVFHTISLCVSLKTLKLQWHSAEDLGRVQFKGQQWIAVRLLVAAALEVLQVIH